MCSAHLHSLFIKHPLTPDDIKKLIEEISKPKENYIEIFKKITEKLEALKIIEPKVNFPMQIVEPKVNFPDEIKVANFPKDTKISGTTDVKVINPSVTVLNPVREVKVVNDLKVEVKNPIKDVKISNLKDIKC